MMKKRLVAAFIAAVLCLAMMAPAMAAPLERSERYTAMLNARNAMREKYGFDMEGQGMFYQTAINEGGDNWTVTFDPLRYSNRLGNYTVRVKGGEVTDVSWSFDLSEKQVKALEKAGLKSDIWGHAQLAEVVALDVAYRVKSNELYFDKNATGKWGFEYSAALAQWHSENSHPETFAYDTYPLLPSEDDLSPEEAIALAAQAVASRYGFAPEAMDNYSTDVDFGQKADGAKTYTIYFNKPSPHEDIDWNVYSVSLTSPSGDITDIYCVSGPWDLTLPDGPLDAYGDAVEEFLSRGAFEYLSYDEKADLTKRLVGAGYGLHLDMTTYALPNENELTLEEATDALKSALLEKRGLTEEMLTLFEIRNAFTRDGNESQWVFDLKPPAIGEGWFSYWPEVGEYHIELDAKTGSVLTNRWSLESAGQPEPTASNWGGLEGWDARVLPWLLALRKEINDIAAKYDEMDFFSLEDDAKIGSLFRENGFDPTQYTAGLPADGDITEEEALALAYQVLLEDCGVTEEQREDWYMRSTFNITGYLAEEPGWYFYFGSSDMTEMESYTVVVAADDGEILDVDYVMIGNG